MPADVGTAFVDIRPDLSGFAGRLTAGVLGTVPTVEGAVTGAFRNTFKRVGAVAAGALGVTAFAGAISSIVSVGIEYDRTMSVLRAVTGATEAQMAAAADTAKRLGADVKLPGVSAAGAAAAMTELAKAGLTVEQAIAASNGALALAIAAQTSEAEAATITANALLAFGLQASEASRVTDLLAGAANASSASMTDIAYGLQMAGAAMAGAGVPIDDTITGLTMLANAGIRGSDAGTLLKTTVTRLTAPSKKAAGMMKELGLQMFDGQGKFVGMRSAVEQLERVLGPMTDAQRSATVNTLFGADAMRFANIAADQGVAAWDKYHAAVSREGQAAQLAAAQNTGLGGALDNLQSTLETVGLAIYEKIQPGLTAFVKGLTSVAGSMPAAAAAVGVFLARLMQTKAAQRALGVLRSVFDNVKAALPPLLQAAKNLWRLFSDLAPILGVVAGVLGAAFLIALDAVSAVLPVVAAALEKVTGFLADHSDIVGALIVAVGTFTGVLYLQAAAVKAVALAQAIWNGVLKAYRIAVAAAAFYQWAFNAALTANPIGIIIALIAGLVAGFIYLWRNNEGFRNFFIGMWNAIKKAVASVVDWITGTAWPAMVAAWDAISGAAQRLWTGLQSAWESVKTWFTTAIDAVVGFVTQVGAVLFRIIEVVTLPWRLAMGVLVGIIMLGIQGAIIAWNALRDGVIAVWNTIWGFVQPIVATIVDTVVAAWTQIQEWVTTAMLVVQTVLTNVWNAIWGVIGPIVTTIVTFVVQHWTNLKNTTLAVFNAVKTFLTTVWNGIVTAVTSAGQRVMSAVSSAWNTVKSTVSGVVNTLSGIVTGAFNAVVGAISGAGGRVSGAASGVFDGILRAARNIVSNLVTIGSNIVTGLINGIVGAGGRLYSAVQRFISRNVPGPIRRLLGISSPSKLMAKYGRFTAQGLAVGMTQGAREVAKASANLADTASGAWARSWQPYVPTLAGAEMAPPPRPIHVTNHYPQAEPTSVTVNRALQYAAAIGAY